MLFQADITITAGKTKADPATATMQIAHGIISQVEVQIPAGHRGLAHLVIRHHEHQIAPSTEDMDIHGNFFPVKWGEYYKSYQPPYELKLVGWNDDDTYPHTFTVYVAILPREAIVAPSVADALKGVLGMLSPGKIFARGGKKVTNGKG